LRKVCAVETGNPSEVISGPEELLVIIKGKGRDWSRDSMCPWWGQRQSTDLFRLDMSVHSVGHDEAGDIAPRRW